MASNLKRIPISKVPGADENGVDWLMACRVRNKKEAREVAEVFISELEKLKDEEQASPPRKTRSSKRK
jgi:hypothetical protein